MAQTQDGFKISEVDLEIRGSGEFMGIRQHGMTEFKIANILRDRNILEEAKKAAFSIVSGECAVTAGEKEKLLGIIKQKYGPSFDLINIG
jgi:ATP-dependent DNA helicase RecG